MNNENMNAVETVENAAIESAPQEETTVIAEAIEDTTAIVEDAPQEEFTPTEGDEVPDAPEAPEVSEEKKVVKPRIINEEAELAWIAEKYGYIYDGSLYCNPNPWPVSTIIKMMREGKIKTDNPIQRGWKWEPERCSYLIHSLMMGFPVPVFWANKIQVPDPSAKPGKKPKMIYIYDILDGKQRLLAIFGYVLGKYALKNVPPVMMEDGTLLSLEGVTFENLPKSLQDAITGYQLVIKSYDNMSDDQKRELFKRLNNGKPLSSKELNIANCKHIGTVSDLVAHPLWNAILTEKAKENKKAVTLVVKAHEMISKNLSDISFESKNLNPVMESINLSDSEKEILCGVLDYALMVYNSFDETIKGAKKKFVTEVHLISLMPFLKKAKDDGIEPKLVADFVVANYSKRTSISERYTTASRDGSARTASIGIRNEEIAEAWANFFTTDDAPRRDGNGNR